MHDEFDEPLTPAEREAMASLAREIAPPAGLEDRLVDELVARGEVARSSPRRRFLAVAAAIIVSLGIGFFVGMSTGEGPGAIGETRQAFALLVFDRATPQLHDDASGAVADASAWAEDLADAGVLFAAEKLRDEGTRVSLEGSVSRVADFPAADAAWLLGGFFLVYADSLEEAERIASECPLLRYGSTIEVRAFDVTP